MADKLEDGKYVRLSKLVVILNDKGNIQRGYFNEITEVVENGVVVASGVAEKEASKAELVALFGTVANTDRDKLNEQVTQLRAALKAAQDTILSQDGKITQLNRYVEDSVKTIIAGAQAILQGAPK